MNILITGGASGLGLAITNTIAAHFPNDTVYFTYYSSADAAKALESSNANTKAILCNFKNEASLNELLVFVRENEIDILINNAFTKLVKSHVHKISRQAYQIAFNNDVVSAALLSGAFIERARKRKVGRIITILSGVTAQLPPLGWALYAAGKNYLLSLHQSWAAENRGFNITSNCVSPEFMQTSINNDTDERIVEQMIASHPLKKLLTVDEVAKTVLFLCESTTHLNGQNIILNAAQY